MTAYKLLLRRKTAIKENNAICVSDRRLLRDFAKLVTGIQIMYVRKGGRGG